MKTLMIVSTVIRLIIPFYLFVNPVWAIILSLFFDGIDGQLFYNAGYGFKIYNRADKILDYWWYIYLCVYIFIFHEPVFMLALLMFLYRTLGQVIGVITNSEKIYLYFPNFFEWFCILIIAFSAPTVPALLISVALAYFVEWLIHISKARILSKHLFKNEIKWVK